MRQPTSRERLQTLQRQDVFEYEGYLRNIILATTDPTHANALRNDAPIQHKRIV